LVPLDLGGHNFGKLDNSSHLPLVSPNLPRRSNNHGDLTGVVAWLPTRSSGKCFAGKIWSQQSLFRIVHLPLHQKTVWRPYVAACHHCPTRHHDGGICNFLGSMMNAHHRS